jgi:hypothetical protein
MGRKRTVTRQPSYGDAVLWLAANDEVSEHDVDNVAGLTTTLLAADLWGVNPRSLATDIIRARHGAGRWHLPTRCSCKEEVND